MYLFSAQWKPVYNEKTKYPSVAINKPSEGRTMMQVTFPSLLYKASDSVTNLPPHLLSPEISTCLAGH